TTTSSTSTPQVVYVTYEAEPTTSTAEPVVYTTSAEEDVTSTAQAATASPTDLISAALYNHNVHRANHSASDVTWLDEIADYAQTTANTCVFAHDMDEGSGDYGQNIAMYATSSNAAAIGEAGAIGMASDMWYNNEVNSFLSSYYGEATPDMSNFEAFGHFTQMVWKNTQTIGCAVKLCAPGTMYSDMSAWYMVCNYRPAGNVGGQYGTNVLKSLGEA
ncbi:CAP domain-containing protein, partial [Xylariales sp. PMI_506]